MRTKSNRAKKNNTIVPVAGQANGADLAQRTICSEVREAFIEFEDTACAAIALALTNSNHMARCIKENGGWEDLETPVFTAGIKVLPRRLAADFESKIDFWRNAMTEIVEKIESGRVTSLRMDAVNVELEYFVRGIVQLLRLQSGEVDTRSNSGCYALDIIMGEKLDADFARVHKACHAVSLFVRDNNPETVPQAA